MAPAHKSQKTIRWLIALFWVQVAAFATLLSSMFAPFLQASVRPAFLPLVGVNSILGLALLTASIRAKPPKVLRRFLILTGASTAGFAVFGLLHNALYGLAEIAGNWNVLKQAAGALELVFFVITIFVCPVCFIVGVLGSTVVLARTDQSKEVKS
jgi:hypothetical protein